MKSEYVRAPFRKFTWPKNSIFDMVKRSHGQHQQREGIGRKQPLISHVVDGENRAHIAEGGIFGVDGAEQNRYESRLPVMTMKNIGDAQNFRGFEHSAGEQSKALSVIGIVPSGGTVEGVAIEVGRIFDEIKPHAALRAAADDGGKAVLVIEGNGYAANDRGGIS